MKSIQSIQISFDSDWFRSGYYVYVVKIEHYKRGTFYYIGQTGDRHHVAARSPFYRLMGHFNPYNIKKGTDSQLLKGLLRKGLIEAPDKPKNARICMEEAIVNQHISIISTFYNLGDFDIDNHIDRRKNVEAVETALINKFLEKKHELFNDLNKIGHKNVLISKDHLQVANQIYTNQNN